MNKNVYTKFIQMKNKIILVIFFMFILSGNIVAQNFNIDSNFPSGNILVEKVKNDTIWLRPDLRDTEGEWFYWCFAINNAKNKTLTFIFTRPNVFTVKGPAVSYDSGFSWKWMNQETTSDNFFSYTFKTNREVRFSMGMPYTEKQFNKFIRPHLKSEYVNLNTLTKTRAGRSVERLIIKPISSDEKYKVLITARHHACEMMANYEMEGIIQKILKDDWLKNNVEFCFIPFIDKDGVENGDQGKNRYPRDHNRDYSDISIYETTGALRNWVPQWAEDKLTICLDLHCPWIKGESNENIYIPGSENKKIAAQQKLFCKSLMSVNKGELKVSDKIYYPFGTGWNTSNNTLKGFSFAKWASNTHEIKLAATIEFPYGNNEGQTVTQGNARNFGEDIAEAIKLYLLKP
jgi:hypothetical protein